MEGGGGGRKDGILANICICNITKRSENRDSERCEGAIAICSQYGI